MFLYHPEPLKSCKESGIYLNVNKSSNKIKIDYVFPLLKDLKEICEAGKPKAVNDRLYRSELIVEAYRLVDIGKKKTNVVIITVVQNNETKQNDALNC